MSHHLTLSFAFGLAALALALAGCNSGDRPRSASGVERAGAESAQTSASLTRASLGAHAEEGAGEPRLVTALLPGPGALYTAESHRELGAASTADGDPRLAGSVRGVGDEPFEVRLEPTGERGEGGEALRVLFSGERGAFALWPEPGEYELTVRTADRASLPVPVTVTPGERLPPLEIDL